MFLAGFGDWYGYYRDFLKQFEGIPISENRIADCADQANLSFSYGQVMVQVHLIVPENYFLTTEQWNGSCSCWTFAYSYYICYLWISILLFCCTGDFN